MSEQLKVRNVLVISDPCYQASDQGERHGHYEVGDAGGTWNIETETTDDTQGWGTRVKKVTIERADAPYSLDSVGVVDVLGVDAGLMGAYDRRSLPLDYDELLATLHPSHFWHHAPHLVKESDPEPDTNEPVEIPTGGFVCSTGYGDGGYELFRWNDSDGRPAKFEVVFIPDACDGCGYDPEDCQCCFNCGYGPNHCSCPDECGYCGDLHDEEDCPDNPDNEEYEEYEEYEE